MICNNSTKLSINIFARPEMMLPQHIHLMGGGQWQSDRVDLVKVKLMILQPVVRVVGLSFLI